jgi:hypothetical protein
MLWFVKAPAILLLAALAGTAAAFPGMSKSGGGNCGSCHAQQAAGKASPEVASSVRARLVHDNAVEAKTADGAGRTDSGPAESRQEVLPGVGQEQRIPRVAATQTGSVVGVLQSVHGGAVGGSRVVLTKTAGAGTAPAGSAAEQPMETVARGDGWFAIPNVPAGLYTLRVLHDGYEPVTQENVAVAAGAQVAFELVLKPVPVAVAPRPASLPHAADRASSSAPPSEPFSENVLLRRSNAEAAFQRAQEPMGEDSQVFSTVKNRWKSQNPDFRRYPTAGEFQFVHGHWWDPYNNNRLKGDKPLFGNRTFLNLSAVSDTTNELRRLPLPPGVPHSYSLGQEALNQNFVFSAELSGGDAAFRPVDWRIRFTPVINLNYNSVGAPGLLNYKNPFTTRFDTQSRSFQEAFAEAKLKDLSSSYDFVSVRAGIQPFNSDFRGFLFSDREPGVRIFGNFGSNRYQYNLAGFATLVKNPNSGQNTLVYRNQVVYIANIYRQDFPWRGYTIEFSFHYDKDDPSASVNGNGFQVRPVPIGPSVLHTVRAYYYGFAGDGHIGLVNVSHAFYQALGHDSYNALAGRPVNINARMGALELSVDRNWMRYRTSFFYASGDRNPRDGTARGFDAILDSPNFAGGVFSFWNREPLDISSRGIGLVAANSLIPDLRSGKASGQANFVNPGIFLYNAGADADITPRLRAFTNLNLMRFAHTEPLQMLLNQSDIHAGIGADFSTGLRYRPALNDNVVFTIGVSTLFPFAGLRQIYSGGPFFGLFNSVQFRY